MRALALAAAASLALSGCTFTLQTPTTTVSGPIQSTTDKVVLEGSRALVLAHNAYQGVTSVLTPLVRAGVFNNDQLDTIQRLNNKAKALLDGADKGLTVAQRAQGVIEVVEQLTTFVRR